MELTALPESSAVSGWALLRELSPRRQIAVATLGAVVAVACFARLGLGGRAVVGAMFAAVLVVLTAVDLDRRLIPNVIVLPAILFVLVAQIALFPGRTLEWVLASLGAALFFFVPLLVYPAGMGMGDVKLAALLGAALGKGVVAAIFAGLLVGAAFASLVLLREGLRSRKKTIAFGPFLAFGGLLVLFLGGR
jgi:leader peptidase (prepilin peptidase)/N-methyltransferase